MQSLKKMMRYFSPSTVSCNDGLDTELPHDQAATDQDYSPTHPSLRRRVPGFDHLLSPVLGITGEHEFIKGFKFDVAVPLSEYFQVFNSWEIPNSGIKEEGQNMMQMMMGRGQAKPNYTFMTQVSRDITNPMEAPGLLMMGKMDSQGRVDSVLLKKLSSRWNMKLSANFMSNKTEDGALGADFQYEDGDSTGVIKVSHHPMQGLTGTLNFMQRVHRNIMLGFDFTHLFTHKKQFFSYGGKFFLGNHAFYASSIQGGVQYHLGYIIPIKKGTTFVSHYKYEAEGGSTALFGLKQRYQAADITGVVNSKGKFFTILSLKSTFYGLKLCAEVDYPKDHYSFGYGISLGQQQ